MILCEVVKDDCFNGAEFSVLGYSSSERDEKQGVLRENSKRELTVTSSKGVLCLKKKTPSSRSC